MTRNCTVYGLYALNEPDHIRYVGQTIRSIKQRFNEHLNCSKQVKTTYCTKWILKHNKEIGIIILKKNAVYGKDECKMIKGLLNRGHKLTNLTVGGEGTVGYKHKLKTKIKIKVSLTGKKLSEKTKRKMSESRKGKVCVPHSEETKKKISDTKKKLKLPSHRKGKTILPHSEETKRKMSESHKARIRKPHSEETKKRIGEKSKGRKHSIETRRKMSRSHKNRSVK